AADRAGAMNQQMPAHGERAFIATRDFRALDLGGAGEDPRAGDFDRVTISQLRLDGTFDHQTIAGGNMPVQRDIGPDGQLLVLAPWIGAGPLLLLLGWRHHLLYAALRFRPRDQSRPRGFGIAGRRWRPRRILTGVFSFPIEHASPSSNL